MYYKNEELYHHWKAGLWRDTYVWYIHGYICEHKYVGYTYPNTETTDFQHKNNNK